MIDFLLSEYPSIGRQEATWDLPVSGIRMLRRAALRRHGKKASPMTDIGDRVTEIYDQMKAGTWQSSKQK